MPHQVRLPQLIKVIEAATGPPADLATVPLEYAAFATVRRPVPPPRNLDPLATREQYVGRMP